VLPIAYTVVAIALKSFLVTIEVKFASLVMNEGLVTNRDDRISVYSAQISTLEAVGKIFKLLFGIIPLENFEMDTVTAMRSTFLQFCFVLCIPALICFIVIVAAFPVFAACSNCPVFLELPICLTILLLFYQIAMNRAALVAYNTAGFDKSGVVAEILFLNFVAAPFVVVSWILFILDPNDLHFHREFAWTYLFPFTMLAAYSAAVGYPLFQTWRERRQRKKQVHIELENMATALKQDEGRKLMFWQYAASAFCSESLQFLDDTEAFAAYFYEKADSWKLSKFKGLVKTYVLPGSRLEINISHRARQRIVNLYEKDPSLMSAESYKPLFETFNEARQEVYEMVSQGPWREFLIKEAHLTTTVEKQKKLTARI
jgi:hypothetical protein